MQNSSDFKLGVIYIALCIFLWSLIPTVSKFAQTSLDHHQYLFYSSIVSFLSILVISLWNKKLKEIITYSKKVFLILFSLGFLDFIFYLLLYYGYKKANGLEVLVIQYTWPVFIVLLSLIILKEEFTKKKLIAIIFGFIGVCLVITKGNLSNFDFSNISVLLVVMIGTFAFALFSVLGKVIKVDVTNAVMLYFFSAIIYSIFTVSTYSSFVLPSSKDIISILINGILLNGISYLFWVKGLQIFDASKVAPYIFITPILGAFFLILFFDEPIHSIYFVGLFFVIISGLINSIKSKMRVNLL